MTPQTSMASDYPTATNTIELTSIINSKIAAVSVYSSQAEVTRVFKIQLKTGQNRVNINGLPNAIQNDTVRCALQRKYVIDAKLMTC